MTRKLTLKRETLTELAVEDLRDVVGAASGLSCPVRDCLDSDVICFPTREGCTPAMPG
jgi:hypothetical protein